MAQALNRRENLDGMIDKARAGLQQVLEAHKQLSFEEMLEKFLRLSTKDIATDSETHTQFFDLLNALIPQVRKNRESGALSPREAEAIVERMIAKVRGASITAKRPENLDKVTLTGGVPANEYGQFILLLERLLGRSPLVHEILSYDQYRAEVNYEYFIRLVSRFVGQVRNGAVGKINTFDMQRMLDLVKTVARADKKRDYQNLVPALETALSEVSSRR